MSKGSFLGFTLFFVFFFPTISFAWGPGVHLKEGLYLLENIHLIIPSVAQLIVQYPHYFLYGCISPDVLIGKGKVLSKNHSHNFYTAFQLTNSADKKIKSYGYGYLTHLAKDIIAHNYFVPNMLQLYNLNRGKIFHVLIEGIVDAKTNLDKDLIKGLIEQKLQKADSALLNIIGKNKNIFLLKKLLFKKGIKIDFSKLNKNKIKTNIEKKIEEMDDYIDDMISLSRRAAINILNLQTNSPLIKYDPLGLKNLNIARQSNKYTFKKKCKGVVPFFVPSISILNL